MSQERFEFKAEIQQLLNILIHSLYTEREIFIRELISNAADALNRLQFEMLTEREVHDESAELAIRLSVEEGDEETGRPTTITVADSGIGMTREEAIENLGTIAQSGAAAFLKRLEETRQHQEADVASTEDTESGETPPALEMIGQFGVGFYSAFMVAKRVRVRSRSYRPGAEAVEWVSDGSDTFEILPADKADRGTEVIVELNDDATEFANNWRLEQIIKHHSDFVAFPIYIEDRAVNRQKPLWRQRPSEVEKSEYEDFFKHLSVSPDAPLLTSHLVTDVPVDIRSILYVPGSRQPGPLDLRADYGVRLYAKGVLIQDDNKDLMPNHLRFVEGVVESEDLPLNVSRETVQRNPAARRIQRALVGRLMRELGTLAENEPEAYQKFWTEFGIYFKEGVATDLGAKGELLPFLRFHSTRTEGEELVSLAEYTERMVDEQPAIYYLLGEDLDSIARSPHLDYFRANDVEVLYLVDPIDAFMVMALPEYEQEQGDVVYPLKNVDDASLELPPAKEVDEESEQEGASDVETIPDEQFGKLVGRLMTTLGARVTQVRESKVLRDHPCRLVTPEDTPGREMQRVYRLMGQEVEVPAKILEINRGHPLIRNMATMAEASPGPLLDQAIEQLYENQLLIDGLHPNPAAMVARIQALMEAATATRQD
jgi:molecular chaperone HtpG